MFRTHICEYPVQQPAACTKACTSIFPHASTRRATVLDVSSSPLTNFGPPPIFSWSPLHVLRNRMPRWKYCRVQLEGEYQVDRLLATRAGRTGREFLVRWKDYDHYGDTYVQKAEARSIGLRSPASSSFPLLCTHGARATDQGLRKVTTRHEGGPSPAWGAPRGHAAPHQRTKRRPPRSKNSLIQVRTGDLPHVKRT